MGIFGRRFTVMKLCAWKWCSTNGFPLFGENKIPNSVMRHDTDGKDVFHKFLARADIICSDFAIEPQDCVMTVTSVLASTMDDDELHHTVKAMDVDNKTVRFHRPLLS